FPVDIEVDALVPIDAHPFQVADELVLVDALTALEVGILDPEDHGALFLAREQPVEQGGACVADVDVASSRSGKAHSDVGVRAHLSMVKNASSVVGDQPSAKPGRKSDIQPKSTELLFRRPKNAGNSTQHPPLHPASDRRLGPAFGLGLRAAATA